MVHGNTPHRFFNPHRQVRLEPKEDSIQNFGGFAPREVRTIVDDMKVVEAKAIMARIAQDYERGNRNDG